MSQIREFGCGGSLAISVQANATPRIARGNVKRAYASGRSQNGQPVEFGQPLVVIA
jgi:hypothetical protein